MLTTHQLQRSYLRWKVQKNLIRTEKGKLISTIVQPEMVSIKYLDNSYIKNILVFLSKIKEKEINGYPAELYIEVLNNELSYRDRMQKELMNYICRFQNNTLSKAFNQYKRELV